MRVKPHGRMLRILPLLAAFAFLPVGAASAQAPAPANAAPPAGEQPDFTKEELDQMLAPIALYPDSLLSQVLMASTYPVEVVEGDRWVKANASLKGDALAAALEKQTWDPSVKSLVNFPPVLAMMSENLSTTVKIGDAFIGQQKEVMASIQALRAKAEQTGNLKSTEEQKVSTQTQDGAQVIVIESSSPEVIYVPQYNPTVVYGSWPYPAYPPYPYYPPGYVASNVISFGLGVACGAAWGYAWGNCNWGHGDVDIDVNRNTNFNQNINRGDYQGNRGSFKHDPAHRQGAAYRNSSTADRVGAGRTNERASQARNDFRGQAEAGRADINRGGADSFRGAGGADRAGDRAGDRGSAGNRAGSGASNRAGSGNTRADGGRTSGFDSSRGGASTRQASSRGSSSRSSASPSRSAPSRSASPSRGGGGGRGGRGGGRR